MNARAEPDRGLRPGGSITHRMDDYGSQSRIPAEGIAEKNRLARFSAG
jgi:hypothetical protein